MDGNKTSRAGIHIWYLIRGLRWIYLAVMKPLFFKRADWVNKILHFQRKMELAMQRANKVWGENSESEIGKLVAVRNSGSKEKEASSSKHSSWHGRELMAHSRNNWHYEAEARVHFSSAIHFTPSRDDLSFDFFLGRKISKIATTSSEKNIIAVSSPVGSFQTLSFPLRRESIRERWKLWINIRIWVWLDNWTRLLYSFALSLFVGPKYIFFLSCAMWDVKDMWTGAELLAD